MKLRAFFDDLCRRLEVVYPHAESRAIVLTLLDEYLGLQPHDIFLDPSSEAPEDNRIESALSELLRNRPLQYVTGKAWFCDMVFSVDESVLIPRPETEELVRWITGDYKGLKGLKIWDIGTGSGAIAVSLAKFFPDAEITAADISERALEIALHNALSNGVNVRVLHYDALAGQPDEGLDIIVSNPPYVMESEKARMRENVLGYEPSVALFVPDDNPLIFYEKIASDAAETLCDGGTIYFEINEQYGALVAGLLAEKGFHDIDVRRDIFDKERMVKAVWN